MSMDVSKIPTGGPATLNAGSAREALKNIPNVKSTKETAVSPRFLVVKRIDGGDFFKISPFLINRTVYGLIGETKNIRKIKDGLLIETKSDAQSTRLMKVEKFADCIVSVIPHETLNTCRGVIYCRDLLNCTETEIEEELKVHGVIKVQRIKVRKDGVALDTPNHILTFDKPRLPDKIDVAMYKLPVRAYIPPPIRCFKCQRFGHTSVKCTNQEICVCGKMSHTGSPCEVPPECVNCKGPHSARYQGCPVYKTELAIQKIKVTEKISYGEAKKKVVVNTPQPNVSYAQATQSSVVTEDFIRKVTPIIENIFKKYAPDYSYPSYPAQTTSSLHPPSLKGPEGISLRPRTTSDASNISKRKAVSPAEESDCSDGSQLSSDFKVPKGKRGWKKGRSRKPPGNTFSQPNLEQEELPSSQDSLSQL